MKFVKGPDQFNFYFDDVSKFKFFKKYTLAAQIFQSKESWNFYHPDKC
jgi:hypothetical protein